MKMYGIQRGFLMDTGCEVSVVPSSYVVGHRLQPSTVKAYAANGTEITVVGRVVVTLQIGRLSIPTVAEVSPDVQEAMLGVDWLRRCHAVWDLFSDTITLFGNVFRLRTRAANQNRVNCISVQPHLEGCMLNGGNRRRPRNRFNRFRRKQRFPTEPDRSGTLANAHGATSSTLAIVPPSSRESSYGLNDTVAKTTIVMNPTVSLPAMCQENNNPPGNDVLEAVSGSKYVKQCNESHVRPTPPVGWLGELPHAGIISDNDADRTFRVPWGRMNKNISKVYFNSDEEVWERPRRQVRRPGRFADYA
jgi:hypothetical protein